MFIRQACRLTFSIAVNSRNLLNIQLTKTHSGKLSNRNFVRRMTLSNVSSNLGETSAKKIPAKRPHDVETLIRFNNITKSQQDSRDYRGLQLENGMKVLLISDPKTDLSAAALAVQVGHMSDPENLPGLAHFCEHMLFLGTEKYPDENGYTAYLSQSGGSSNAATYPLMTKYHFNVAPNHLEGALDRFSQFFIAPLFTPSATDREINAVNSEHEKNLSNDTWRIKQVQRHFANQNKHPYGKFGTGNKATLCDIPKSQNVDVREELLEFHKKWYSANIMSLAVIGKESLDELETMVMKYFTEIENKNVQVPSWPREPFGEDCYAKKVMIVPVKDVRTLTLAFTTDDQTAYYKSAPDSYLTHLIGHESKGSLLAELRRLGWCNDLMAGHQNTLNGFGFFEIVVDLTEEGMQHVDDILQLIFEYLHLLRCEGPQKWIFDETVNINEMRFRFKDKEQPENLVTHAVSSMQIYPMEEVLTAPYMSNDWRPELIANLLKVLVPSKCRVILVSQSYELDAKEIEPYYKTKYCSVSIAPESLKKWETCQLNSNFALPKPNAFIPSHFDMMPYDADLAHHPVIILDTPFLRVWHKQDETFLKPKTCMAFDMTNPMAYSDPLNCCLNHIMVKLITDQLNEYLYDAELAGLRMQVNTKSSGIDFAIRGYSDKQEVLLEKLLNHLFDFEVDEKRFNIIKEQHIRTLKNFKAEQPYQHAVYYLALLLTETAWSNYELLDAMELVTVDRLKKYANDFFSRIHTECFIYGNVTKQQTLDVVARVNKRLECTDSATLPLMARQMIKKREYKLSSRDSYLFEKENEFHKCNCTQLYFQCGPQTDSSNVMISLIAHILSEPCYDCLRTKEQLGYIVFSGVRRANGANGIRIIVQSTRHPSYLEDRIENFLVNFSNTIKDMPLDEFERYKEALAQKKLEKPKTLYQRFSRYAVEIGTTQYHFDRDEAEVALLRKITKDELIKCYHDLISREGDERRVLSVHIVSNQIEKDTSNEVNEKPQESADENAITCMDRHTRIVDLVAFKSSKELYPLPRPFLDIKMKGARSKL